MEHRLTQEPYKGRVLGKTGYVTGASCLSGYILDAAGKPAIAFSIMINKISGPANAKHLEEDVCKVLVDSLPRRLGNRPDEPWP
jgi:D-alanyl-D-alanine carboxypeptidase